MNLELMKLIRSQKARGFEMLQYSPGPWKPGRYHLIQDAEQWSETFVGKFHRPCPSKPRHGFVGSRIINTREELDTMIAEIKATGEDVEILIMDPINASASAVLTSTTLAIGDSNDGATSGKAETFPVLNGALEKHVNYLRVYEKNETEVPYTELVYDQEHEPHVVQLRAGPPVPATKDHVTKKTVVSAILVPPADDDLVKWEKDIEETKGRNGVVVNAEGMSLSSHWAVHAILNGLPVITSREIKLGEVLKRTKVLKPSKADYKRLARFVRYGLDSYKIDSKRLGPELISAFATLHNFAVMDLTDIRQQWLLGKSVGIIPRIAACLGLGELRYCSSQLPQQFALLKKSGKKISRSAVYSKAVNKGVIWLLPEITLYHYIGSFSSAFGGKKWGDSMMEITQFMGHVLLFVQSPSKETFERALEHTNKMAHLVHNGGLLYNKLILQSDLDLASSNPGVSLSLNPRFLREVPLTKGKGTKKHLATFLGKLEVKKQKPGEQGAMTITPLVDGQIRCLSGGTFFRLQVNGQEYNLYLSENGEKLLATLAPPTLKSTQGTNNLYSPCKVSQKVQVEADDQNFVFMGHVISGNPVTKTTWIINGVECK